MFQIGASRPMQMSGFLNVHNAPASQGSWTRKISRSHLRPSKTIDEVYHNDVVFSTIK